MNIPSYLVAQNVHGPCFTTPLFLQLDNIFRILPQIAHCDYNKYFGHIVEGLEPEEARKRNASHPEDEGLHLKRLVINEMFILLSN